MEFNLEQAIALLGVFGGEETQIKVIEVDDDHGHSGQGLYAYYAEYPEEGTIFLG